MVAAKGILTARAGMTSHAGRGGPRHGQALRLRRLRHHHRPEARTLSTDTLTLKAGTDFISIDGSTGEVFAGQLSAFPSEVNQVLVEKKLKPEDSELFARFQKIMTCPPPCAG